MNYIIGLVNGIIIGIVLTLVPIFKGDLVITRILNDNSLPKDS